MDSSKKKPKPHKNKDFEKVTRKKATVKKTDFDEALKKALDYKPKKKG